MTPQGQHPQGYSSPNNGLAVAWFKGLKTPEEKKAREEFIRNNILFAELLLSILSDRYQMIEKKGFKEEDYAQSGWQTLQAFRNGKLAELTDIAELLNFIPDKGK